MMNPYFEKFGFPCALLTGSTPQKEKKEILQAIEQMKIRFDVIDSTDFLDADRQARAKVDIIKLWKSEYTNSLLP